MFLKFRFRAAVEALLLQYVTAVMFSNPSHAEHVLIFSRRCYEVCSPGPVRMVSSNGEHVALQPRLHHQSGHLAAGSSF